MKMAKNSEVPSLGCETCCLESSSHRHGGTAEQVLGRDAYGRSRFLNTRLMNSVLVLSQMTHQPQRHYLHLPPVQSHTLHSACRRPHRVSWRGGTEAAPCSQPTEGLCGCAQHSGPSRTTHTTTLGRGHRSPATLTAPTL